MNSLFMLSIMILFAPQISYGMNEFLNKQATKTNELCKEIYLLEPESPAQKLSRACQQNAYNLAQEALQEGVDLNAWINPVNSHLCRTLRNPEQLKILELLLEYGADPNKGSSAHNYLPIMYTQTEEQLSLLIKFGANIHARDENGNTILINAIYERKKSLIPFLLKSGVTINAQNNAGNTALHGVIDQWICPNTCEVLINTGADIYIRNEKEEYSWSIAKESIATLCDPLSNQKAKSILQLLEDTDKKTKKKFSYMQEIDELNRQLIEAAHSNDNILAEELLNNGALCQIRDSKGDTPLIVSCKNQNYEMCKLLLNAGAKVDATNAFKTALYIAACHSNSQITALLLKHGAEIDRQGPHGKTPLMQAIRSMNNECTNTLLNAGANIFLTDACNWTALHHAAECKHEEGCTFILERIKLYNKGLITALLCLKKLGEENKFLKILYTAREKLLVPHLKPYYEAHSRETLLNVRSNANQTLHIHNELIRSKGETAYHLFPIELLKSNQMKTQKK